jgi:hypothetical protein
MSNYKNLQHSLDKEKSIHNPDLYAIWNLKSFIAKINPYNSTFFIYTDAGAWRIKKFKSWPNINFVVEIRKILNDKILLGQFLENPIWQDIEKKDFLQGGFFAGSKIAITSFYKAFFVTHDKRLTKGLFIGKDQTLMDYLVVKDKIKSARINLWNKCAKSRNEWFFYQFYFANDDEYECDIDKKDLLVF